MKQRLSMIGRSVAVAAAGVALGGMVAVTAPGGFPAAADELELPVPGVGPTEAQEAGGTSPAEDRDPHSFAPSMPEDICDDPGKTCGFAETH